ncbi:MAG: PH domain-containing protein [Acidobacteriota bacterium]
MTAWLLRLLRVPPEPQPPLGSDGSLRVFRASKRYLQYRLVGWALKQSGALVGLIFSFIALRAFSEELEREIDVPLGVVEVEMPIATLIQLVELVALPGFVLQLAFGYFLVRLDWQQRWYMVSDVALRIREGLYQVREQTMTVANVQNMSVKQGPLQKLFGMKDLEVHVAGGGGSSSAEEGESEDLHRGIFRGLDNAEEIRDLIRAALARHRDAGLGDPGDVAHLTLSRRSPAATAAAQRLLEESRQLRVALEARALE